MRHKAPTLSIVIPCLNEEAAILRCIYWAKEGIFRAKKIGLISQGEIIVVDNGSTDKSVAVAKKTKVIVLQEQKRGYGSAYKTGIKKSKGDYIIIGDADATYDFRLVVPFIKNLNQNIDLVLGSRFTGSIQKGAMPIHRRFLGNPLLTSILNISFGCKVTDAMTGMRAFNKKAYKRMELTSNGMEYASEMIIKATLKGLSIAEVPIPYYARIGTSKLIAVSDAWRHIKFILLYSPSYLFILPGTFMALIGFFVGTILLFGPLRINNRLIDIHTMSISLLLSLMGVQLCLITILAKLYTRNIIKIPPGPLAEFILNKLTTEKLLKTGAIFVGAGCILFIWIILEWMNNNFGHLARVREILFSVSLIGFGINIIHAGLFYGLLDSSSEVY